MIAKLLREGSVTPLSPMGDLLACHVIQLSVGGPSIVICQPQILDGDRSNGPRDPPRLCFPAHRAVHAAASGLDHESESSEVHGGTTGRPSFAATGRNIARAPRGPDVALGSNGALVGKPA